MRAQQRNAAIAALLALTILLAVSALWGGAAADPAGGRDGGIAAKSSDHAHPGPAGPGPDAGAAAPAAAPTSSPEAAPDGVVSGIGQGESAGAPGRTRQSHLAEAAGQQPAHGVPRGKLGPAGADRTAGLSERGASPAQGDQASGAAPNTGGCLPEYGAAGQCLPVVPPSLASHLAQMKAAGMDPSSMPHHWSCAEVRTYFPDGLPVRIPGTDPQHLDPTADGTACGTGD